jgi:hypothetical protein
MDKAISPGQPVLPQQSTGAIGERAELPAVWRSVVFALAVMLALALRAWGLADSGLQNDEQVWHQRSAQFIQSIMGPLAPEDLVILRFSEPPYGYVDLTQGRFSPFTMGHFYPFTIQMQAHHPGTPAGFLMGLCYVFLARGTTSISMGVASVIEVCRYPGVLLGALLVALIYLGGRRLVGDQAALLAASLAAVEPILVGYSRLARIDMSAALWHCGAFLAYVHARQTGKVRWAIAAGCFAGLALATNTYGAFLAPAFIIARLITAEKRPPTSGQAGWLLRTFAPPDRLDILVVGTWITTYLLAYPNLWPNPVIGILKVVKINLSLPHLQGESSPRMPVSHLFYILRSPEHVLPWTLILGFVGVLAGLRKRATRQGVLLLLSWGLLTLLLFSLPAGRKSTKNFLIIMPAICLLAGVGVDNLIGWVTQLWPRIPLQVVAIVAVLLLGGGLATTVDWWPYPQLYTWPWRPDPQTLEIREIFGGWGGREAAMYIHAQDGPDARIGCFTGENNLIYYHTGPLGSPTTPEHLKEYDWLVVFPKLTFAGLDSHPLVHWVRTHEPTHVIYHHQVELVRLYRLKDFQG